MWSMWDAPSDRDYYDQFMDPRELALLEEEDPDNELPVAAMAVQEDAGDESCPF